ncbi:hypothetical protein BZG35_16560 [Brevundimonas sp. LM2]|uniref:ATP-binding protein n=1 Tax=Brevundimonas sp. LM2 TaxID=1938605 RepID=UPI000983EC3D|nr:ATP-binding protein [Brevundimonas sp. LM2]AQR63085.1 hypothetical protein BZG35_16560 [Brevundimonas sp. LM2]
MSGSAPLELKAAEDTASTLLARMPGGLVVLDASLRIRRVNPYFADLCGRHASDLEQGIRFHDLSSVAGRIFIQSRLQTELSLSGRIEELALDLCRPDGVRVPILLNAVQDISQSEAPGDIIVTAWRAAAKRAYEAEVPKARQAAADAMQVKADFLANISHEIRTPLNGIVGVAGALRRTALDEAQLRMLSLITQSSEMLERFVNDVLDVSKAEAGALALEPRSFNLRAELGGVIETTRIAAEGKGLRFSLRFDDEGDFIADPTRLKQVLGNLLGNALKFTQRGEVRVGIGYDDKAGALTLEVEDTGIGFDPDAADGLFQRFNQADNSITRRFGGTGLGLSIVKTLVELMGGTIGVRSRPGEGSRFSVRIPSTRTVLAPKVQDVSETQSSGNVERVLLVEDHPVNQQVVRFILEAQGLDVVIAENGEIGVEAFKTGRFDVILMDMQMPVMDGLTATRAIRAHETAQTTGTRTPIAMLTANALEDHRDAALEAGADLHITKPVTPERLLAGIQRLLAINGATAVA